MQSIFIRVIFREDTSYGSFQDCIEYEEAEYASITQQDLDTIKQKKLDAWIAVVSKITPEKTKQEALDSIQAEIDGIIAKKAALETQKIEAQKT